MLAINYLNKTTAYYALFFVLMFSNLQCSIAQKKMDPQWTQEIAKVNIERYDAEKEKGTVLEELIKLNGTGKLEDFLEKDNKTLVIYSVTYKALIKLAKESKTHTDVITQHGVWKALPAEVREVLNKSGVKKVANKSDGGQVPIQFNNQYPLEIRFILENGRWFSPTLLTKRTDLYENINKAYDSK